MSEIVGSCSADGISTVGWPCFTNVGREKRKNIAFFPLFFSSSSRLLLFAYSSKWSRHWRADGSKRHSNSDAFTRSLRRCGRLIYRQLNLSAKFLINWMNVAAAAAEANGRRVESGSPVSPARKNKTKRKLFVKLANDSLPGLYLIISRRGALCSRHCRLHLITRKSPA